MSLRHETGRFLRTSVFLSFFLSFVLSFPLKQRARHAHACTLLYSRACWAFFAGDIVEAIIIIKIKQRRETSWRACERQLNTNAKKKKKMRQNASGSGEQNTSLRFSLPPPRLGRSHQTRGFRPDHDVIPVVRSVEVPVLEQRRHRAVLNRCLHPGKKRLVLFLIPGVCWCGNFGVSCMLCRAVFTERGKRGAGGAGKQTTRGRVESKPGENPLKEIPAQTGRRKQNIADS